MRVGRAEILNEMSTLLHTRARRAVEALEKVFRCSGEGAHERSPSGCAGASELAATQGLRPEGTRPSQTGVGGELLTGPSSGGGSSMRRRVRS